MTISNPNFHTFIRSCRTYQDQPYRLKFTFLHPVPAVQRFFRVEAFPDDFKGKFSIKIQKPREFRTPNNLIKYEI